MNWKIKQNDYQKEDITKDGNKYLIGNGYLGVRGTMQEYNKSHLVAVNLSGIYDQYGTGWREPLNAPNGLYTYIEVDGSAYKLPDVEPSLHSHELDFRHGVLTRNTVWKTHKGTINIRGEQFTSALDYHFIGLKYEVTLDFDSALTIVTGIDGDVWDIHGPHYKELNFQEEDNQIGITGSTNEGDKVSVCVAIQKDFQCKELIIQNSFHILKSLDLNAEKGTTYTIYKYISIFTSKDSMNPTKESFAYNIQLSQLGYQNILNQSIQHWEQRWKYSEVVIEGDEEAMTALNYSLYHLHCIAPRHSDSLSIAARGLSGQTYKGAVFWDTEMFMLDFFLYTEPEVVKTLLKYRIDSLEGALQKAKEYGYQGAFYAWESQEGGKDACSDYNVTDVFTGRPMRTYFRDKQVHISSAIAYGIMKYISYTQDTSLYLEGGAKVILECARFYYDLLLTKVGSKRYEILDVIGPDEYHERVNNNAYTNRMAKFTFEAALIMLKKVEELDQQYYHILDQEYNLVKWKEQLSDAIEKIYIKQPQEDSGVIEQFDGYFQMEDVTIEELKKRLLDEKEYWGGADGIASHTKIIKQADVVTMLNLFSSEYSEDILRKNYQYYEPKTEHGSSLSACMYAMLACECDEPDMAYPFFLKTANADLIGGGKEWAGLVYIGGTHPAAAGGAYMTAIKGFGGFQIVDDMIVIKPHLPKKWKKLSYYIQHLGTCYQVEIQGNNAKVKEIGQTTLT